MVLVTFWPGTSPTVLATVNTGFVVPVLTAVVVRLAVVPLETPTATAASAAELAVRLWLRIRVVESKICAIVVPTGMPTPEIGCPTCKSVVVPEASTTVVVADVPVAAMLSVEADP